MMAIFFTDVIVMPGTTVAQLLARINFNVELSESMLNVDLSNVKQDHYPDVVLIAWLGSKNLLDTAKIPDAKRKLGQISAEALQIYLYEINKEISEQLQKTVIRHDILPFELKTKGRYINATVVTHYVYTIPHLKYIWDFLLVNSSKITTAPHSPTEKIADLPTPHINTSEIYQLEDHFIAEILLKWFRNDLITNAESDRLTQIIDKDITNNTAEKTQKLVVNILIEEFTRSPQLMNLIYIKLIEINREFLNKKPSVLPFSTLNYFFSILAKVSEHYPATMGTVIRSLGIKIPTNLDPIIEICLKQDLRTITGLKESEWPTLIYYMLLFVFSHAKTTPRLLHYSSADLDKTQALSEIATEYTESLNIYESTELFPESFSQNLLKDINELFPQKLTPEVLATLCFGNSIVLRNLFVNAYQKRFPDFTLRHPISLLFSNNPFTLGQALYFGKDVMSVSGHDFRIIMYLKNIAEPQQGSALDTSRKSINNSLINFEKMPKALQIRHSNNFFTLPKPQTDSAQNSLNMDKFEEIRQQIGDEALRNSISIDTIHQFTTLNIANYHTVINSLKQGPTKNELRQFFAAFPKAKHLSQLSEKLVSLYASSLTTQLASVEKNRERLCKVIDELKSLAPSEEKDLNIKWYEFYLQLTTCLESKIRRTQKTDESDNSHTTSISSP